MPTTRTKPKEADKMLQELRHILVGREQEVAAQLEIDVAELKEIVADEKRFAERIQPYLESQVTHLQENFPTLFGAYLGTAIRHQIRESQDEIIDALYPIIGKLISKFLRTEIQRISAQIDERLKNPFSWDTVKARIKAFFAGVSYDEYLLQQTSQAEVEAVFIVNKESGLNLGHYSIGEIDMADVVGGMMTGTKDFLEHAFEKEHQELETVQYDDYQILLYTFQQFYMAVVIEGLDNPSFRQDMLTHVLAFWEKYKVPVSDSPTQTEKDQLSAALKNHFNVYSRNGQ